MRLHQMIGDVFLGNIPCLKILTDREGPYRVKLISVDVGGIWVECQAFTEKMLELAKRQDASNSPRLFLPFSSIVYLANLHDSPALSEQSLGLKS
jgi:hypothetical protein